MRRPRTMVRWMCQWERVWIGYSPDERLGSEDGGAKIGHTVNKPSDIVPTNLLRVTVVGILTVLRLA